MRLNTAIDDFLGKMTNKFMYTHLDIRNFFAACEQYLNPKYKGKPVIVYNESDKGQRIVAVSKEAREGYGLTRDSYMPRVKRMPGMILVKSNIEKYRTISEQLYQRCCNYFEKEKCAISKPYIDDIVIKLQGDLSNAIKLARRVEKLYKEFGFDMAIGISFNKDYANIAVKLSKKYGLTYFGSGFAKKVIYRWPVIEFPQIGTKRKEKLNQFSICTIGDIANSPLDLIIAILGKKVGMNIHCSVLGIDPDRMQMGLFG